MEQRYKGEHVQKLKTKFPNQRHALDEWFKHSSSDPGDSFSEEDGALVVEPEVPSGPWVFRNGEWVVVEE